MPGVVEDRTAPNQCGLAAARIGLGCHSAQVELAAISHLSSRGVVERSARSHAPAGTADSSDDDIGGLPRIKQDLAQPPSIPELEQISTGGPLIVEAELVARVLKRVVDGSGTEIHARTFNGAIPRPLTVRQAGGN